MATITTNNKSNDQDTSRIAPMKEQQLVILKEEIKKAINGEAMVFGMNNTSQPNLLNKVNLREWAKSHFNKEINLLNDQDIEKMGEQLVQYFEKNK